MPPVVPANVGFIKDTQSKTKFELDDSTRSTPFLNIVQTNSSCLQKTEPDYVEDAEAGMLLETRDKVLHTSVNIIPISMQVCWSEMKEDGGGIVGVYSPLEVRKVAKERDGMVYISEDGNEIKETFAYVLLLPDTDKLVLFPMRSTGLKYARKWNDLTELYITELQKSLPEGIQACNYHLVFNLDTFQDGEGKRKWFSPVITFKSYVDEDQYNLVQSRLEDSKKIGFLAIQESSTELDPKVAEAVKF